MSGTRKVMILAGLVALVLAVVPATSVQAERGVSMEAVAGNFSSCCNSLKVDLRKCKDFEDDPEAYAICRAAAFDKFDACVDDLLAGFGVSPLDAAVANILQTCPVQLPL